MLSHLELIQVRNHQKLELDLAEVTVLIGPNGCGKTSVLEAISLLSVADSWKTERDSEVVSWGEPFARIVSDTRELVIQRSPALKRYRIDGISKRLTEILGTLPSVLFQPDDSELVHGAPSYRRKTLDRLLSQTVAGYAKALQALQKVLKQRNRLLKQIQEGQASEEELVFWDKELAVATQIIQGARRRALGEMAEKVQEQFVQLLPHAGELLLHYHQSPVEGVEDFLAHLGHNHYKEIAAGSTLYGPHREDILFTLNGHPASEGMSRGQTRATVLAFKLAELAYIESHTGVRPILLLDDIFAEFDQERRARVLNLLQHYQAVLTVTDLHGLDDVLPKGAKVIEL